METTSSSFDLILNIADKLSIAPGLLFVGTDGEAVASNVARVAPAFTKVQIERIRSTMQKSVDDTIEAMTGAAVSR